MNTAMETPHINQSETYLKGLGLKLFQICGLAGIVALVLSYSFSFLMEEGTKRFLFSYLVNYSYFLSISLGALFFVALQHLTRSGWSVVVRRVAEILAANIPLFAILFIPIFLGLSYLYPWSVPENVAHDHLLQWKKPYLNIPFFMVRSLFYLAVWWYLANYFLTRSVEQDQNGDKRITLKMEKISAPGMILFALTVTFASFDWLMSLDPHWFSTIFGVYYFSGCIVGFFAFLCLAIYLLQKEGILRNSITIEHYHDFGKWLFAFIFFWAYIAFSQYMLIWYGNIPEETGWVYRRTSLEGTQQWGYIGILIIAAHFVIPFMGLLSRYPKRRRLFLAFWAAWMLVMHWVDLYWLIMPEFSADKVPLHLLDLGCFLGIGGLFLASTAKIARGKALVPLKDPRLEESITFENA